MRQLSGYSLPLSPSGAAAFVTAPPWHFSGDMLWVDYRADPAAVAAFLPPGLALGDDPGACAAVFVDWQWCSQNRAELADPVRCQFKECFLVLACRYDDIPSARYPYVWVDRALPLVRGWIQGVPKGLGSIWMTRTVGVGVAGGRRRGGERFAATLTVDDRRLVEAEVTLVDEVGRPPALADRPPVNTVRFPSWRGDDEPEPALVRSMVTDQEYSPIWQGKAALRFLPAPDADLRTLAPVQVGSGYVFSYAETVVSGVGLNPVTAST